MHLCLYVVWQCWACIWRPNSRELSTPGRPLGDHILGDPLPLGHPWATKSKGAPTPGPPLGDHILGGPYPLGHPWATKT